MTAAGMSSAIQKACREVIDQLPAAAVTNAVRHATCVRLRSLPIRMEHLVTAQQARR